MKNLDFGIVGNCSSGALISSRGSIDWLCLPYFDSGSVFAKILDDKIGGQFEIIVGESYSVEQNYIPRTNLLATKFSDGENIFEIIDFMPRYVNGSKKYYAPPDLIRYFRHISGRPEFSIFYNPRLEYASVPVKTSIGDDYIKSVTSKGEYNSVYLYSDFKHDDIIKGKSIILENDKFCLLSYNQKILEQNIERESLKLERTKVYWLNWSEKTKHYSIYGDQILRSALVLKLLSFDKSGAILAALTTSIPETIGEVRNWDYRFCWLRDASMVIRVLTNLGHKNVVRRYLSFILELMPEKDEKIQIMYGIHGEKKLTERILDHLSGYEGSKPVRVGNAAYKQKQHDIFGVLMDVIHQQFRKFNVSMADGEALWTITRGIVRVVNQSWKKPDRGIWELRDSQYHFTFSKVLCWVAIDRAIKIAGLINQQKYVDEWSKLRSKIHRDIHKKAWNAELNAFTQYYGSEVMDASNLLMEAYGFIDANDPRFIGTVELTKKELCKDGLMYRYKNKDDFGEPKSSFTICTFWMINSLFKIGRKDEAKEMFENLLSYGNHLGLFSEDIDFESKRLLGNFPQAYSHLALIETAITLTGGELEEEDQIRKALKH